MSDKDPVWSGDWRTTRPATLVHDDPSPQTYLRETAYFGWVWEPSDATNVTTATKSDSSEVDLTIWAVGGMSPQHELARLALREMLHRQWRRRLTKEAILWLQQQPPLPQKEADRNREAIADCVTRAARSTWWAWADGSRLHFWRWPAIWRKEARDGAFPMMMTNPRKCLHFISPHRSPNGYVRWMLLS